MKRIPLFLVLTLMAAWWYTSWYWYTCNIKWACQQAVEQVASPDLTQIQTVDQDINPRETETQTSTWEEIQSLSRGDVLVGNSVIPQAPISSEEEENLEDEASVTESSSWSISTESSSGTTVNASQEESTNQEDEEVMVWDLCTNPLVGPISIAWGNNTNDVIKLETFLIANAYLSSSDGVYGNADFEAVKQLQLDYKAQMLDPWGIDAPTGYVWKTTVATINSIWCKN